MGYYTQFTGNVTGSDTALAAFRAAHTISCDDEPYHDVYAVNPLFFVDDNSYSYDALKWYNWEEEVSYLSRTFPELTFYLDGTGEGWDEVEVDMWKAVFRNGKSQVVRAVVTFPDFDMSQLD